MNDHLFGRLVRGKIEAVFRWGIIVELDWEHKGLIDALYVNDEDVYIVGRTVEAVLDGFDERKQKYILRPPHQTPLAERLRAKGFDV